MLPMEAAHFKIWNPIDFHYKTNVRNYWHCRIRPKFLMFLQGDWSVSLELHLLTYTTSKGYLYSCLFSCDSVAKIITEDNIVLQTSKQKNLFEWKCKICRTNIGHNLDRLSPLRSIEEIFTGNFCTSKTPGSASAG